MDTETELTPWEDLGAVRSVARSQPVQHSSRRDVSQRREDHSDTTPVDREEFFAIVGPCLALCGAVGMAEADRREWLEAAYLAVGDMPILLLEWGAKAALRTADHPSKIVPAIMQEVGELWRWRKRPRGHYIPPSHQVEQKYCTGEEAAAILAEFGLRSAFVASDTPTTAKPRMPTAADYAAMGVQHTPAA